MEAIRQQFFNLSIMEQAFPLILAGLKQTIIICLIVIPLGLAGGRGAPAYRASHNARSGRYRQCGAILVLQCVRGGPATYRSWVAVPTRRFAEGYIRAYPGHRLVHCQSGG